MEILYSNKRHIDGGYYIQEEENDEGYDYFLVNKDRDDNELFKINFEDIHEVSFYDFKIAFFNSDKLEVVTLKCHQHTFEFFVALKYYAKP